MLQTRWSAEAWAVVRVEFRRAVALRSEIRRAGWLGNVRISLFRTFGGARSACSGSGVPSRAFVPPTLLSAIRYAPATSRGRGGIVTPMTIGGCRQRRGGMTTRALAVIVLILSLGGCAGWRLPGTPSPAAGGEHGSD